MRKLPPSEEKILITISHTPTSLAVVHKAVMIAIGSADLDDAEKKTAREFLAYIESREPKLAQIKNRGMN